MVARGVCGESLAALALLQHRAETTLTHEGVSVVGVVVGHLRPQSNASHSLLGRKRLGELAVVAGGGIATPGKGVLGVG